jgi:hypothetical protein
MLSDRTKDTITGFIGLGLFVLGLYAIDDHVSEVLILYVIAGSGGAAALIQRVWKKE